MKILIIEDENKLAEIIKIRLEQDKYHVDISNDGEEGLYNALSNIYDLIILDVMLPNIDGFSILKELKKNSIKSKVIMLTAASQIEDKLEGFNLGADDYLTKPFHLEELTIRINVKLHNNPTNEYLVFKDLKLSKKDNKLICNNESIDVIKKEYEILEYLINNSNQMISKEQLYDAIWGIDNDINSNNLEAYISFIRKKLKAINTNVTIKSYRGLGYKLEVINE